MALRPERAEWNLFLPVALVAPLVAMMLILYLLCIIMCVIDVLYVDVYMHVCLYDFVSTYIGSPHSSDNEGISVTRANPCPSQV